jgi:hypothetical protein
VVSVYHPVTMETCGSLLPSSVLPRHLSLTELNLVQYLLWNKLCVSQFVGQSVYMNDLASYLLHTVDIYCMKQTGLTDMLVCRHWYECAVKRLCACVYVFFHVCVCVCMCVFFHVCMCVYAA